MNDPATGSSLSNKRGRLETDVDPYDARVRPGGGEESKFLFPDDNTRYTNMGLAKMAENNVESAMRVLSSSLFLREKCEELDSKQKEANAEISTLRKENAWFKALDEEAKKLISKKNEEIALLKAEMEALKKSKEKAEGDMKRMEADLNDYGILSVSENGTLFQVKDVDSQISDFSKLRDATRARLDIVGNGDEKVDSDSVEADEDDTSLAGADGGDISLVGTEGMVGEIPHDDKVDKHTKFGGESSDMSKSGDETTQIKSESDLESDSADDEGEKRYECPDPEFHDFEKGRDANLYKAGQIWACYDDSDGMPRFYAKLTKASSFPFEVSFKWLEAVPISEAFEDWINELPVGCGNFKLGTKVHKICELCTFLHQMVNFLPVKERGSLILHPKEGEIWAVIKDWDITWMSSPENHRELKYEIVEVISDFVDGAGCTFWIRPDELYKFSHLVPSSKMSGSERDGVPIGSYELDPAALPLNPDHLHFPGKVYTDNEKVDSEVCCPPSKSAVLTDTAKKLFYDSKIRVSAPTKPPPQMNRNHNTNQRFNTRNNPANGFRNLNQQQATGAGSSFHPDVFVMRCPLCQIGYRYAREHVNKTVRCQTCQKPFMACEISVKVFQKSRKRNKQATPIRPV